MAEDDLIWSVADALGRLSAAFRKHGLPEPAALVWDDPDEGWRAIETLARAARVNDLPLRTHGQPAPMRSPLNDAEIGHMGLRAEAGSPRVEDPRGAGLDGRTLPSGRRVGG